MPQLSPDRMGRVHLRSSAGRCTGRDSKIDAFHDVDDGLDEAICPSGIREEASRQASGRVDVPGEQNYRRSHTTLGERVNEYLARLGPTLFGISIHVGDDQVE